MDEELEKQLAEQAANTNVNDVNDTYSGSTTETSDDDLVIKSQYQDSTDSTKYSSTPNTTTSSSDSATGTGLSAATGTQYSWNTSAEERANLDYQASVLESRENLLSNRQEIETNAQTAQTQYAMQQYAQNQSSEKVGWTGGYILDAERQVDYLKQTIQAQMYGQMELQKYGYDTSLAAARLAYDTNKYDLALEYYNTALSRAVSEAEITGYYISPETSEMLNQYSIAASTLNSDTATEAEKQQADSILAAVYDWFEANGISKQGVETYSHIVEERTWKQSIDQTYEYLDDANTQISTDTFVKVDADGNKIYGETDVEKINFATMSSEDILDYIYSSVDSEGNSILNETARNQYLSRLDSIAYEMENSFTTWCTTQGYIDSDGNVDSSQDYATLLEEYFEQQDIGNKLETELARLVGDNTETDNQDIIDKINAIVDGWTVEIELPDGTTKVLSLTASGMSSSTSNTDYSNYINEYDGNYYIKDVNNVTTLINILESEEMSSLTNVIMSVDLSDSKAVSDWMANWASSAADIPVVNMFTNMLNTVTDFFVGDGSIGAWISDIATSGSFKEQVQVLTALKDSFTETIGENNMTLLKEAAEEYNNLSDSEKASLSESKLSALQTSAALVNRLNAIQDAINYASNYDSNILSDPWDYIGDTWKRSISNWDDGYQWGDVTRTVINWLDSAATTVASCVVGAFEWFIGLF